jgi:hypothetical protein
MMKRVLFALLLAAWLAAPGLYAGEDDAEDAAQAAQSKVPSPLRQESLELPGVTACHQCEWRPKPNQMAAAEQCGMTPDGTPKVGLFECGFSADCERVCNFVECLK